MRRATLSGKVSPAGTITSPVAPAARAPRAIRAAPVLIGSMRGRSWVVPSGKMATVSRSGEGPVALGEGAGVPVGARCRPRRCGAGRTPPRKARSTHPTSGTRRSDALAMKRGSAAERRR